MQRPIIRTTTSTIQAIAQHTVKCLACTIKARRLLAEPEHLERQELLCAIEWCAHRASGRKAHA